jgi:RND family efflux transporter MFP subunit
MAVILLVGASAASSGCQQAKPMGGASIPVAVYELPIMRTVTDYEEFPGQTEAIPSVQVLARVSGYMTKALFKDGTIVKEGTPLFEIDDRQYRAELERAEGNLQQIEAHRRRLEKEYLRAKNLLARGSISTEEYDRYEADFRETEANFGLAAANRDLARLNVDWCVVRAGTTGLLSRRMVDPGNLVKADETVLTSIVNLDPLYVDFDVHEQAMLRIKRLLDLRKVKAESIRDVPVEIGLSDEPEDKFPHKAIVDFTDNKVDVNTGTLRFRAKLDNPDHFITPGLFVRVRLPIGDPHPALLIREQALVRDQGQKGVFIVRDKDAEGKPILNDKKRPIVAAIWSTVGTPGVIRDGYVEIQQGIKPDDRVVVSGMQRLRNGREVKAEKYIGPEPVNSADAKETPAPGKAALPIATAAPPAATAGGLAVAEGQTALRPQSPPTASNKQTSDVLSEPSANRSPALHSPVRSSGPAAPGTRERSDATRRARVTPSRS